MVRDLELDLGAREHFFLSGDIHHYERIEAPGLLHVVAGGRRRLLAPRAHDLGQAPRGGALAERRRLPRPLVGGAAQDRHRPLGLHPARGALCAVRAVDGGGGERAARGAAHRSARPSRPSCCRSPCSRCSGVCVAARRRCSPWLPCFALIITALPVPAVLALRPLRELTAGTLPPWLVAALGLTVTVVVGVGVVGVYMALLTRLGLEETQAFTTLDHPGFKHFLRLRVRSDGRGGRRLVHRQGRPLARGRARGAGRSVHLAARAGRARERLVRRPALARSRLVSSPAT
jgi:hypothetical protein